MRQGIVADIVRIFDQIVCFFIPGQAEPDERGISSGRLLVSICLITSLFALLYVSVSLLIGFWVGAALMFSCFVLLYGILLHFKRTGRYRLCANRYLGCCCLVAVLGCSAFSGGPHSMVFPWFALIPVAGVLLLGFCRATLCWFLFSSGLTIAYGVAAALGFTFPELYQLEYLTLFYTICVTGLVMILFFIALTFDHNRSLALQKILEQNDALAQARNEAEAASRAKSEFLANMSHEIRTPMTAIMGFTALCQHTGLNDKQRSYLAHVESSSQSLLGIINDILDFSKIEAGMLEMEEIDFELEEVIDNVAGMVGVDAARKGLELVVAIDSAVPRALVGDPLRLGQALGNLAGNAVKFTGAGTVRIGVELVECKEAGCLLRFTVRDTGIGMNAEERTRLFVAFSQADTSVTRKFGGTGLGLVITKKLVEMMAGEIAVESSLGLGSCFSFTARFRVDPSRVSMHKELPSSLAGLKVLVVDDNEWSRQVLLAQLAELQVAAEAVDSGRSALETLAKAAGHDPFDLVLMDWQLPDMDGIETVQRMRSDLQLERQPVTIMVTAFSLEKLQKAAAKVGVSTFLVKPVNVSRLRETIVQTFSPGTCEPLHAAASAADSGLFDQIRGARILVVDDNSINRQVVAELFKECGVTIDFAVNGKEAVAAVCDADYDLVLMDLQMPVMSGYEATAQIRCDPRHAELPIIAMTAHAMSGVREECLAAGMNDYLSKPIHFTELQELLQRWIGPEARARRDSPAGDTDKIS